MLFKTGKNKQLHYLRVMINDVGDNLQAGDYEKAEMLYKEIRMMYDQLPEFGRNELYDDVMDVVHKMDAYYFNMVMIELDSNLKSGDMHSAILSYEKLTKVFERLDIERQNQLVSVISAMGRRLGMGVGT
jgi:outer membrane protein assembly factor BamD (BamD/ComL family)